jgi:hypothetical protein
MERKLKQKRRGGRTHMFVPLSTHNATQHGRALSIASYSRHHQRAASQTPSGPILLLGYKRKNNKQTSDLRGGDDDEEERKGAHDLGRRVRISGLSHFSHALHGTWPVLAPTCIERCLAVFMFEPKISVSQPIFFLAQVHAVLHIPVL